MSASVVVVDTNNFAAEGPVISVSSSSGGDMKVTPSPRASYSMLCSVVTGDWLKLRSAGLR